MYQTQNLTTPKYSLAYKPVILKVATIKIKDLGNSFRVSPLLFKFLRLLQYPNGMREARYVSLLIAMLYNRHTNVIWIDMQSY